MFLGLLKNLIFLLVYSDQQILIESRKIMVRSYLYQNQIKNLEKGGGDHETKSKRSSST